MPQTADAQFYQLYFQEPGVAEAEFEKDPRLTLRANLFGASGEGVAAIRAMSAASGKTPGVGMVPRSGGMLPSGVQVPLPSWLSEADLEVYAGEFCAQRFSRPAQLLSQCRSQLGVDGGVRRHQGHRAGALHCRRSRPGRRVSGAAEHIANMKQHVPLLRDIHMLPGCGHWTQQERPAEVSAAIVEFLRSLPD